jgi:hypothetical protein
VIECGQSRHEVVSVGFLAWLFAKGDGQTSGPGRPGRGRKPAKSAKPAPGAGKPAPGAGKPVTEARTGVYSVERSVTTLIRSGLKRRKTTRTTKEWRHGNCQVRHKSKAAATRCRNP